MNIIDLQNIPYVERGRSANGADCYGLVILYYRHILGLELLDYPDARGCNEEKAKLFLSLSHSDWVSVDRAKQHDVILFGGNDLSPCHVGVMIDSSMVMQITEKHGCTCVKLARLKNKVKSIYRHKKLI